MLLKSSAALLLWASSLTTPAEAAVNPANELAIERSLQDYQQMLECVDMENFAFNGGCDCTTMADACGGTDQPLLDQPFLRRNLQPGAVGDQVAPPEGGSGVAEGAAVSLMCQYIVSCCTSPDISDEDFNTCFNEGLAGINIVGGELGLGPVLVDSATNATTTTTPATTVDPNVFDGTAEEIVDGSTTSTTTTTPSAEEGTGLSLTECLAANNNNLANCCFFSEPADDAGRLVCKVSKCLDPSVGLFEGCACKVTKDVCKEEEQTVDDALALVPVDALSSYEMYMKVDDATCTKSTDECCNDKDTTNLDFDTCMGEELSTGTANNTAASTALEECLASGSDIVSCCFNGPTDEAGKLYCKAVKCVDPTTDVLGEGCACKMTRDVCDSDVSAILGALNLADIFGGSSTIAGSLDVDCDLLDKCCAEKDTSNEDYETCATENAPPEDDEADPDATADGTTLEECLDGGSNLASCCFLTPPSDDAGELLCHVARCTNVDTGAPQDGCACKISKDVCQADPFVVVAAVTLAKAKLATLESALTTQEGVCDKVDDCCPGGKAGEGISNADYAECVGIETDNTTTESNTTATDGTLEECLTSGQDITTCCFFNDPSDEAGKFVCRSLQCLDDTATSFDEGCSCKLANDFCKKESNVTIVEDLIALAGDASEALMSEFTGGRCDEVAECCVGKDTTNAAFRECMGTSTTTNTTSTVAGSTTASPEESTTAGTTTTTTAVADETTTTTAAADGDVTSQSPTTAMTSLSEGGAMQTLMPSISPVSTPVPTFVSTSQASGAKETQSPSSLPTSAPVASKKDDTYEPTLSPVLTVDQEKEVGGALSEATGSQLVGNIAISSKLWSGMVTKLVISWSAMVAVWFV